MRLRKSYSITLTVLVLLVAGYVMLAAYLYGENSVEMVIYERISDDSGSGTMTGLPMPSALKSAFWMWHGGKESVERMQIESGDAIKVIMNYVETAPRFDGYSVDIERAWTLADYLYCMKPNGGSFGDYEEYAEIVDSDAMRDYLRHLSEMGICSEP